MIYHGTITMENGAELPFELYPEDAPLTVENFVKLVKEGYYEQCIEAIPRSGFM